MRGQRNRLAACSPCCGVYSVRCFSLSAHMHTHTSDPVRFSVNSQPVSVAPSSSMSLLMLLRNDLALNSPKYGCGLGECGACTVLVDGKAARSCAIPANGIAGREIITLEGLGSIDNLHPVQQAFVDEQAAQCGYCLSGMIMMTAALLARHPDPSDEDIRRELSGNLCRCGTHLEIFKAVRRASLLVRQRQDEEFEQNKDLAHVGNGHSAIENIAKYTSP